MLLVKPNRETKEEEKRECNYSLENEKLREEIAVLKQQLRVRLIG